METQRESVARVVWPWRAPRKQGDGMRGARRRACIQALVMLCVAVVLSLFGAAHMAAFVLALGVLTAGLGWKAPAAFQRVEAAMRGFGRWVGGGMTWLLLTPFFYLFVTPLGLLRRLRGQDGMQRRFPGGQASYWEERGGAERGTETYGKQF